MATDMKRVMLSLPKDLASETDEAKRHQFYDKPYSKMYRYLIQRGLDALKAERPRKPPENRTI